MRFQWILLMLTASVAWTATLTGRATDICEGGVAIPGVEVIVAKNGKPIAFPDGRGPVLTDKEGKYSIPNLPNGNVEVRFEKIKYNPKAGKQLELKEPSVLLNAEMWRAPDHNCKLMVALYEALKLQPGSAQVIARDPTPVTHIFGELSAATSGKAKYPTVVEFKHAGVSEAMLTGLISEKMIWTAELQSTQQKLGTAYSVKLK